MKRRAFIGVLIGGGVSLKVGKLPIFNAEKKPVKPKPVKTKKHKYPKGNKISVNGFVIECEYNLTVNNHWTQKYIDVSESPFMTGQSFDFSVDKMFNPKHIEKLYHHLNVGDNVEVKFRRNNERFSLKGVVHRVHVHIHSEGFKECKFSVSGNYKDCRIS